MDPKTQRGGTRAAAIILASPPLVLLLFLVLVNPDFVTLWLNPDTLGIALPLLALLAILMIAAYPAMFWSLAIFQSGRRGRGILLAAAAFAVLVLPAILLLLLTPAALALAAYYSGAPFP